MATATVRISPEVKRVLEEMAEETGRPMTAILAEALEQYRRERFLRGLAGDFAALRADPRAWKEERDERRAWDAALGDDLDD